jgi:hypothetical protein
VVHELLHAECNASSDRAEMVWGCYCRGGGISVIDHQEVLRQRSLGEERRLHGKHQSLGTIRVDWISIVCEYVQILSR